MYVAIFQLASIQWVMTVTELLSTNWVHIPVGVTLPPLPSALCVLRLVVLTLSYGGNSAYRLASSIERATGRAVRGVVMWDFMAPFGRLVQGGAVGGRSA